MHEWQSLSHVTWEFKYHVVIYRSTAGKSSTEGWVRTTAPNGGYLTQTASSWGPSAYHGPLAVVGDFRGTPFSEPFKRIGDSGLLVRGYRPKPELTKTTRPCSGRSVACPAG
jgi:hypothetical protein